MLKNYWNDLLQRLKSDTPILIQFMKNPVAGMRRLPDWDWTTLLPLQAVLAASCGLISGIVSRQFLNMISGLIALPISSLVLTALAAGFFYYTFFFLLKRELSFRKLYLNLVFANVPLHLLLIVEPVLPLASMLGLAATCLLMVVAFVENFHISKTHATRLMAGLFAIYAIFWVLNSIRLGREKSEFRDKATPESLDILENEFKKSQ